MKLNKDGEKLLGHLLEMWLLMKEMSKLVGKFVCKSWEVMVGVFTCWLSGVAFCGVIFVGVLFMCIQYLFIFIAFLFNTTGTLVEIIAEAVEKLGEKFIDFYVSHID